MRSNRRAQTRLRTGRAFGYIMRNRDAKAAPWGHAAPGFKRIRPIRLKVPIIPSPNPRGASRYLSGAKQVFWLKGHGSLPAFPGFPSGKWVIFPGGLLPFYSDGFAQALHLFPFETARTMLRRDGTLPCFLCVSQCNTKDGELSRAGRPALPGKGEFPCPGITAPPLPPWQPPGRRARFRSGILAPPGHACRAAGGRYVGCSRGNTLFSFRPNAVFGGQTKDKSWATGV